MNILLIEPYFTGSHSDWALGYQRNSRHQVDILSLPGQFWKWRMHGGAVTLARMFAEKKRRPDLLLMTDMLDVTTFLALTRTVTFPIPVALYFHENQLCYPWSPNDRDVQAQRDHHYGFINVASALAADTIFFNSEYHRSTFLEECHRFLKNFPDFRELKSVEIIRGKSAVLPLGLDLHKLDTNKSQLQDKNENPIILWNHRWEYDKNPEDFFHVLFELSDQGLDFHLVILGENFSKNPTIFDFAKKRLNKHILHIGYVESSREYAAWLWKSDLLPVTSNHDFFGASVIEAIYCGCRPFLPKRLSYPGLIPVDQFSDCYYHDLEDLKRRLRNTIKGNESFDTENTQKRAATFDWQILAPQYDDTFSRVISTGP